MLELLAVVAVVSVLLVVFVVGVLVGGVGVFVLIDTRPVLDPLPPVEEGPPPTQEDI